jgi:hypothetical protein
MRRANSRASRGRDAISGREFDLTKGFVYRSTDGGDNWTAIWRGDNLARYVAIDPRNSDVIYVSTGIFDRHPVWAGISRKPVQAGAGALPTVLGETQVSVTG